MHRSRRLRSHTFVGTSQWGAELCGIENASQNFRLMPTTIQMGVQATFARQIGYAAYVTIVQPLFGLIAIRIAGEYVSFGAIGQIHRDAKHMPFHLLFHLFDDNNNSKIERSTKTLNFLRCRHKLLLGITDERSVIFFCHETNISH